MPTAELREHEWNQERAFLPFISLEEGKEPNQKELDKIELFEKGLENEIGRTDTIEQAMTKMVRMALCAEFGAAAVKSQKADQMVSTIVAGIMAEPELRKQALYIIDRFAK